MIDKDQSGLNSDDVFPALNEDDSFNISSVESNKNLNASDLSELSEVQFGPTDSITSDMLSETIVLMSTDSVAADTLTGPSPPTDGDHENFTLNPSIHRVNLLEELIVIFKSPDVVHFPIKYTFVNEEGEDLFGVSRDEYTSFWAAFCSRCAEGEEVRVPALNPKWQSEEWIAIGRILLKAYQDLRYFPLQLAPAFTYALILREDMVLPDILMSSFMLYLSKMDRETVHSALNDNLSSDETDDLVDILDRFGYKNVPKTEDLKHTFLQIAHKEIIQKPKYALDAMASVAGAGTSLNLLLPDSDAIEKVYSLQTPTVRKVLKLLKAEPSNSAEAECFGYLQGYIKAQSDPLRLRSFLHYVTGSDTLCVSKIDILFTSVIGLGRRPVAHTCGPTLELPSTYRSYPELGGEFDSILSTKECLFFGSA